MLIRDITEYAQRVLQPSMGSPRKYVVSYPQLLHIVEAENPGDVTTLRHGP